MRSVSPKLYDSKYYFYEKFEGADQFKKDYGLSLTKRLSLILNLAQLSKGQKVLDIGCAKGELAVNIAKNGAKCWGIDYSKTAIKIANKNVQFLPKSITKNLSFFQCDAKKIPFEDDYFDCIFMLDFVEHIYLEELTLVLNEAKRLLKKEGKLIIHTGPNRWYFDYGYSFYRFFRRLNDGCILPLDPRNEYDKKMHVNEQTLLSLKNLLRKNYFYGKVWLNYELQWEGKASSKFKKLLGSILYKHFPFNLFFVNHIIAVVKPCK